MHLSSLIDSDMTIYTAQVSYLSNLRETLTFRAPLDKKILFLDLQDTVPTLKMQES